MAGPARQHRAPMSASGHGGERGLTHGGVEGLRRRPIPLLDRDAEMELPRDLPRGIEGIIVICLTTGGSDGTAQYRRGQARSLQSGQ